MSDAVSATGKKSRTAFWDNRTDANDFRNKMRQTSNVSVSFWKTSLNHWTTCGWCELVMMLCSRSFRMIRQTLQVWSHVQLCLFLPVTTASTVAHNLPSTCDTRGYGWWGNAEKAGLWGWNKNWKWSMYKQTIHEAYGLCLCFIISDRKWQFHIQKQNPPHSQCFSDLKMNSSQLGLHYPGLKRTQNASNWSHFMWTVSSPVSWSMWTNLSWSPLPGRLPRPSALVATWYLTCDCSFLTGNQLTGIDQHFCLGISWSSAAVFDTKWAKQHNGNLANLSSIRIDDDELLAEFFNVLGGFCCHVVNWKAHQNHHESWANTWHQNQEAEKTFVITRPLDSTESHRYVWAPV